MGSSRGAVAVVSAAIGVGRGLVRLLDADEARIVAGLAALLSAFAIGIYLISNTMPLDAGGLAVLVAFGYCVVVGAWLPGRYAFIPAAAVLVVAAVAVSITLGPLVFGRQLLIHHDAMQTSAHVGWIVVVSSGPLLAAAVAMRQRAQFDRLPGLHHAVALALPIAALLVGVLSMPEERRPTTLGIVASADEFAEDWEYHLTTGELVVIDRDRSRDIGGFGGERTGALLLTGTDGRGPWHLFLPDRKVDRYTWALDCHELPSHGFDRQGSILFDIGLVLPKHDVFAAGAYPQNGRYEEDEGLGGGRVPFCISPDGEVLGYLSLSYAPCDLLELRGGICGR